MESIQYNKFVYILIPYGGEWDDITIILNEKEAIELSIKYPKMRVELFEIKNNIGYTPTYRYYQNGNFFEV